MTGKLVQGNMVDGHMVRILGVVDQSDYMMKHLVGGKDPMDIIYLEYTHDEGILGSGPDEEPVWKSDPDLIHRYRGNFWVNFWLGKTVLGHPVIYYEGGESNQSAEIGTIWLSSHEIWSGNDRIESGVYHSLPWEIFPDRYTDPGQSEPHLGPA